MKTYRTDEEGIAAIKKWWQEFGRAIIVGVVIASLSVFGWFRWQGHIAVEGEHASSLYEELLTKINTVADADEGAEQGDEIEKIVDQLVQEYSSSPYSMFASLQMAKVAVEQDDLDAAVQHLQSALEVADSDAFRSLIRLRLARLFLVRDELDEALSLVNKGDALAGVFSSQYLELKGDILLAQGEAESAKSAYKDALAVEDTNASWQSIVQMKLDQLGTIEL